MKKNIKEKKKYIKKILLVIGIIILISFFTKLHSVKNEVAYVKYSLPESMNKPFFMDNNGIASDFIVNPQNGYMISENTLNIPICSNSTFTFDKSLKGVFNMLIVYLTNARYEVAFNEDFTYGKITPIIFNCIKIPSSLVNFSLSKINDSPNWLRKSNIFGYKFDYILRDLSMLTPEQLSKIPNNALVFK